VTKYVLLILLTTVDGRTKLEAHNTYFNLRHECEVVAKAVKDETKARVFCVEVTP
jgi:hypothetical protein